MEQEPDEAQRAEALKQFELLEFVVRHLDGLLKPGVLDEQASTVERIPL